MLNIDQDRIDNQELTWYEAKYLQDRCRLPAGYPMPEEEEAEEDEVEAPVSRVTPLEDQSVPTIGANGGIEEEEGEEDYLEGWNNKQRLAELSSRGLSLEGTKDDYIARLRRSDAGQLIDEDLV